MAAKQMCGARFQRSLRLEELEPRLNLSASLVSDVNQQSDRPSGMTISGGSLYFAATRPSIGTELFKTDGALAGAGLVADIAVSFQSSGPAELTDVNGTLFFAAYKPIYGFELWKTNGTAEGTVLVRDINPETEFYYGASSSYPHGLTNVSGTLFFAANDGIHGLELWKSDGTKAGTKLVKDIALGGPSKSAAPRNLVNVGGSLYFSADDGAGGVELWRSDGTTVGTKLVKDIVPGEGSSKPDELTAVGGSLYFTAADASGDKELWKSDGTTAGTIRVKDINPGAAGSAPVNLLNLNGVLYFSADNGSSGRELWKSGGTAATTVQVKDIRGGALGSNPKELTSVGSTLYFSADNGAAGVELWKSDGTAAGTTLVKNIRAGAAASSPERLTNVGGVLYFFANDGINGDELWKSNGSAGGTVLVKDIHPGAEGADPGELVSYKNMLVFVANDGKTGEEIWVSQGTAESTSRGADIDPLQSFGSNPNQFTAVGNKVFFVADDGIHGENLWVTDGTAAGAHLVKSTQSDLLGSQLFGSFGAMINFNGVLYFTENESFEEGRLWRSDGTAAGTYELDDSLVGVEELENVNGVLFFNRVAKTGSELWRSDGTAAGMRLLHEFATDEPNREDVWYLRNIGGMLYFFVDDPGTFGDTNHDLWRSDGTPGGTLLVKDLPPSTFGYNLIDVNGAAFFIAYTNNGQQLWKTTENGTSATLVKQFELLSELVNVNGQVYFVGDDGVHGRALWKSNGTAAGTTQIHELELDRGIVQELTNAGGVLYFFNWTTAHGGELWKSNGTTAGTVEVKDLAPGSESSSPSDLTAVGSTLYFSAYSPTTGREVWQSDGTSAGTKLVADVRPGPGGSGYLDSHRMVNAAGTLYFAADNGAIGNELWKLNAASSLLSVAEAPGVRQPYAPPRRTDGFAGEEPEAALSLEALAETSSPSAPATHAPARRDDLNAELAHATSLLNLATVNSAVDEVFYRSAVRQRRAVAVNRWGK